MVIIESFLEEKESNTSHAYSEITPIKIQWNLLPVSFYRFVTLQ